MAPSKFEKHIKKELQEREIRPSSSAWDSLSEKLDADVPPSKKKGSYLWYGIAASFIGLLIVAVLYFNRVNSVETSDNQIVETEEKVIESTNVDGVKEKNIEEALVENDKTVLPRSKEVKTEDRIQIPELKNQIASVKKNRASIEPFIEKVETSDDFKEEIINAKILEIVATVDSLEQNNTALTDEEVDDLLRNAQEEIFRDKLFNQKGSIDAMALLTEVEDELDKSFRDQIFESLKTGFLKVRTAVADRNK